MIVDAPEKMFNQAVATVKELAPSLVPGWTYRGEYLSKPKHNTLVYSRIPLRHVILFDISTGLETFLPYENKQREAERLGLEVVPLIHSGMITDIQIFRGFLDRKSCLGGQKIEGVVVKPRDYNLFGQDKKVLFGKFVSEAFKEIHQGEWKKENPTIGDIIDQISQDLKTQARWNKAVQHLAEAGELEWSPKDIGKLMREVPRDINKEYEEEIKDRLYKLAWPKIQREVTNGLPQWYKEELMKAQFEKEEKGESNVGV